jgi:hypothetical protein
MRPATACLHAFDFRLSGHPADLRVMHGRSGAAERAIADICELTHGETFPALSPTKASVPASGSSAIIRNQIQSGTFIGSMFSDPGRPHVCAPTHRQAPENSSAALSSTSYKHDSH